MLLPLKAVILKKPRKDGNHLIYFQFCFSAQKRVLLSSKISIPAANWNKQRQQISKSLPIQFGNATDLNAELARMYKAIEAIIDHGRKLNVDNLGEYVKNVFTPEFNPGSLSEVIGPMILKQREPDLFEQIDDYLRSKEKRVASVAVVRAMKERLIAFQQSTGQKLTK